MVRHPPSEPKKAQLEAIDVHALRPENECKAFTSIEKKYIMYPSTLSRRPAREVVENEDEDEASQILAGLDNDAQFFDYSLFVF
jgi:hypothetical protein